MAKYDDINKPVNPFEVVGNKRQKVFYKPEEEITGPDRYAILKTTDNGAYVRGDLLYYHFEGIDIFTEINNAIFVDKINHTLTIKDYSKALNEITPTNPEERQYVILMYLADDIEDKGFEYSRYTWESMTGRKAMYRYIKDNIESSFMDPDKSVILTDNVALKDALTVTQFVKYLQNANLISEDDLFDIDEYRIEDGDNNGTDE